MPFVDVFSLLISFLLVTAVFLAIGIHEVQIPFFTNAPEKKEKTRDLIVNVDVDKDKVSIATRWTAPPEDEKKYGPFSLSQAGLTEFHNRLSSIRRSYKDTDLVTLFTEDDVDYQKFTNVLDAIKLLQPGDPVVPVKDPVTGQPRPTSELFPKVVMGSVVL